jgi:predicted TIM-barrel enzyme
MAVQPGHRSGADAVVLTGATTGREVNREQLDLAWKFTRSKKIPLYLGSGVNFENLKVMKSRCDGMIVGSVLRENGVAGAKLDLKRVKKFVHTWKKK